MRSLNRVTLVLAVSCGLIWTTPPSAQAAAPSEAIEQLMENVRYWRDRGRTDKVAQIWRKVLRSDPDHTEALAELSLISARAGRIGEAKDYLSRLERVAPSHPQLSNLRRAVGMGATYDEHITSARAHVEAKRYDEAVAGYRKAFGDKAPRGALGLEFYETLGGTKGGWAEAREGLERLIAAEPDNARYALSYARLLTYDSSTRREGIARLSQLVQSGTQKGAAGRAWGQALRWLRATRSDKGLFDAYLEQFPEDEAVKTHLSELTASTKVRRRPKDVRGAQMRAAYDALDASDNAKARAIFETAVQRQEDDVEALAGLALVHLEEQQFDSAATLYQRVKKLAPERKELWEQSLESAEFWGQVDRGKAAFSEKDYAQADRAFTQAIATSRTLAPDAQMLLGNSKLAQAKFDDAEVIYEAVVDVQPAHVPALTALVELYLQQGKGGRALKANANLFEVDPDSAYPEAWIRAEDMRRRAQGHRKQGELPQALSLLRVANKTNPNHATVLLDLTYAALEANDLAEARQTVDQLTAVAQKAAVKAAAEAKATAGDGSKELRKPNRQAPAEPEPPDMVVDAKLADVWVSAAESRFRVALETLATLPRTRFDDNIVKLERRLKVKSRTSASLRAAALGKTMSARHTLDAVQREVEDDPELLGLVALGWSELGVHERALNVMHTALNQMPAETPTLQLQLASILHKAGKEAELLKVIRELAGQPLSTNERAGLADLRIAYAVRRADIARERGELNQAYNLLAAPLRENPEDISLMTGLGRIFISAGEYDEAIRVFSRILKQSPTRVDARQGAAQALAEAGRHDEAGELALAGIRLMPHDPRVYLAAARTATMTGDDGDAMDHYSHALALTEGEFAFRRPDDGGTDDELKDLLAGADSTFEADRGSDVQADLSLRREIRHEMEALRARYNTTVSASLGTRYRTGEQGLGRLFELSAPLTLSIPTGFSARLEFTAIPLLIDSGDIDLGNARLGPAFGSTGVSLLDSGQFAQDQGAIGLELAIQLSTLRLWAGASPLGFQRQTGIAGVRWRDQFGGFGMSIEAYRREVRDSVLSYGGTVDFATGEVFGGVTRNGGRVDLSYDTKTTLVYLYGSAALLLGQRMDPNVGYEAGAGINWTLYDWDGTKFWTGLNALGIGYKDNRRFFTLGHGGYFSPQTFLNVGVPVSISGTSTDLVYSVNANIGVNWFTEDAVPFYPNDPDRQQERESQLTEDDAPAPAYHAGQNSFAFALGLRSDVAYDISSQLKFGAQLNLQLGDAYSEVGGALWLRFTFDQKVEQSAVLRPYELPTGEEAQ